MEEGDVRNGGGREQAGKQVSEAEVRGWPALGRSPPTFPQPTAACAFPRTCSVRRYLLWVVCWLFFILHVEGRWIRKSKYWLNP